jgi:hypothetical protein
VAKKSSKKKRGERSRSPDSAEKILADFLAKRWKADPFERALTLAKGAPPAAARFAHLALEQVPEGGTFLDAVLGFVEFDDWPALVSHAVEARDRGPNDAADSVIAHGTLQRPEALRHHLERVFALRPNEGTYYENWPWRESGTSSLTFLQGQFSRRSAATRTKAWRAMLETRDMQVLKIAVQLASLDLNRERPRGHPGMKLNDYLTLVGFEHHGRAIRRLYPESLFHLTFPGPYALGSSEWMREHPTWNLPTRGRQKARFGGKADGQCASCGGRLHHILTLDPVPPGLGVTGVSSLTLVSCMSCLGWEQERMFFAHEGKRATPFGVANRVTPQFPAKGFKPTGVHLVPTPRRWYWQDWATSNSRENLHRVGGQPCWIQDAQFPVCPRCEQTMAFLLQLDSNLPTADGGEWLWGSGGIAYGFWCDGCRVSAFLWQCT